MSSLIVAPFTMILATLLLAVGLGGQDLKLQRVFIFFHIVFELFVLVLKLRLK